MNHNLDSDIDLAAEEMGNDEEPLDWESTLNWFVGECLKENIITSREQLKSGPCLCVKIRNEELCFSPFIIGVAHGPIEKARVCQNHNMIMAPDEKVAQRIEQLHDKAKRCAESVNGLGTKEAKLSAFTECMRRE